MKIINKCLTKEGFKKYIEKKKVLREIDKIVLHHTWDTIKQWKNKEVSCSYYKKMYEKFGFRSGQTATLSAVRETDPPHILQNSSRKYPGTPIRHRLIAKKRFF